MIKNCLFIWHPIKVSIKWEWLYNIFPNLILSSAFLCCLGRNQMAKHDLKAYLSADDKNTPFKRPNGNLYSKKDGFLRKPFNLLNIEGGGEKSFWLVLVLRKTSFPYIGRIAERTSLFSSFRQESKARRYGTSHSPGPPMDPIRYSNFLFLCVNVFKFYFWFRHNVPSPYGPQNSANLNGSSSSPEGLSQAQLQQLSVQIILYR